MVVSGAIAAAFALPGCAPAGYNPVDYPAGAAPAAVDATPSPAGIVAQDTPVLTDKELTTELTGATVPRMGTVVQDEDGKVLYRFADDKAKPPTTTCEGDCAKVWPPALTDGEPELDGVSADDVGTVERADGTTQLTIGGWPVYRYIGDTKAGTWKGQNVAGKWFVVNPDGSKNLTCLPKISKAVAPPADDAADDDSGAESAGAGTDFNY